MTTTHTVPSPRLPLRLWPGIAIVALQVFVRFVLPAVAPDAEIFGLPTALLAIFGGVTGLVAVAVWWLFFSRAPWSERVIAIVAMVAMVVAMRPLMHVSIQNGMMGMMFVIYAIPVTLTVAFVGWALASGNLSARMRMATMVAAIAIGCGVWLLARTDGSLGAGSELAWRWTPTAEERLLAQAADEPVAPARTADTVLPSPVPEVAPAAPTVAPAETVLPATPASPVRAPATPVAAPDAPVPPPMRAEWPGFRGPNRDSVVHGVQIATDWSAAPPVALWRRPIGPGWSSFSVSGDVLYTQEQRGDDEIVAAYKVSTGEPVWRHRDPVRFWESNGGAGPRATPTLHAGRVYAFGATGLLNALDAATGRRIWSTNVATDVDRKVPDWGFSSSPLIVDDVVIVAAEGTLVGYDMATGHKRWTGPSYGGSYSSPHRATLDGVEQVVLAGGPGAIGVAPATGAVLWKHEWSPGAIVQPAITGDGDLLLNALAPTGGLGIRRIAFTHSADAWTLAERWTSVGLKPYFNDFVVHDGHAYGFDGNILSCISLGDGTRKWKGGRYGNGQMILLADQDVLLVLSEEGELVLVSATPDQFKELARMPALDGKTWNHPVLVGDVLLVRNGQEMAAFRLPRATS